MKKIFLLSLMVFVLVFLPLTTAGELKPDLSDIIAKTSATEKVPVIILFYDTPTPADISVIKSDGASIKYHYTIINAVAAQVPAQAVDKIAKRAFVELVEPDYEVKLVLDTSTSQIQADKVWDAGITGKNIDVAILDTGIHDEHPSLIIEKEIDYTGEGTDDLHGHGTHVAGTVASTDSTYKGVAYGADLFNVKILNQYGSGSGSDVIKGIEWAVDNGAEIISMSLGAEIDSCDGTDALSRAVDKAVNKRVVVVVATGNSGPDSGTITTPGCSKKGIAVGAVNNNDNVPSWSSRGPTDDGRVKPDLVAPGVGITSTWKDNSFKSLSGTSMSTPHVSGVVALLLETDSSLEPADIKNILKTNALDLGLDENTQGAGRVDAYASYFYVSNITNEPENETEEDEKETPLGLGKRRNIDLPPAFNRDLASAGTTPDSWTYGFKKFSEGIGMFFTFDKVAKAEKYAERAELRLSEAREMTDNGKPEFVDELMEEYQNNLEKANEISRIAQQAGKDITKVTEIISIATSIHLDVLEDVLERVPEQAKPSIQRAIASSKKGNEEALNILEKAQPEKAAEIHLRVAEKRLIKAQEKAEEGEFEDVENMIEEYEGGMGEASRTAEIARGLGNNTTEVEQVIAEATSTHLEILAEVHERVPEQAKSSIESAMAVSSNGREKAVEALKEKDALGDIPEEVDIPVEIPETPSSGSGDAGSGSDAGTSNGWSTSSSGSSSSSSGQGKP